MSNPRAGKVSERIQQIIARRLEKGLRDPRMGFVTITDVRVTGDLQHASVFYTVYGSDEEQADSAAALKAATGMLRTEVGKQLGTRLTPTLEFIHDELPESAEHLSELLAEARRRDDEAKALAATAKYAGDPDPYQKPRDVEAEEGSDSESREDSAEIEDFEEEALEALDEVDDDFEDEDEDGLDEEDLEEDEERD
ncbi:30S ribosome-binding factor RbfA [Leucobacter sp. W1478]|uniref:30S ribosome-binding factor RbfA n=1 Tax=Leucobacter sp. W1478 TaxID=3439065 RepID=UPI003F3D8F0D